MLSIRKGKSLDNGASNGASSRFSPMNWFSRKETNDLIGVDIGTGFLKAVTLAKRQERVVLTGAGIGKTPHDAMSDGALTDGLKVAYHLRSVCDSSGIRSKRAACALSGDRIYCQVDDIETADLHDVPSFILRRSSDVLPYSADNAVIDYEATQTDARGEPAQVLWVAAPPDQLDWTREVVSLAGKTPTIVDTQACALANVFLHGYDVEPNDAFVLLGLGARTLTAALVGHSSLLFSRTLLIPPSPGGAAGEPSAEELVELLSLCWTGIKDWSGRLQLRGFYLCGGRSRTPNLREALAQHSGLRVDDLDPFRRITYSPSSPAGQVARDHGTELATAVGLALRGVEDAA